MCLFVCVCYVTRQLFSEDLFCLKGKRDELLVPILCVKFFKIYSFADGEAFYPDFVLFLIEKKTKQEVMYQIFIEPKGDQFLDAQNTFEQSKESWKQKLLIPKQEKK